MTDLYSFRLKYPKSNPMNLIAKLLMNSLYGRFGLNTNYSSISLHGQESYEKELVDNKGTSDKVILGVEEYQTDKGNYYLIETLEDSIDKNIDTKLGRNYSSIAIAAAVTAEARIYMSIFKNIPSLKLYYTDTDSIFIIKSPEELEKLIPGIVSSSGLGKLKLEGVYTRGIFVSPKCYYLEKEDGSTKIRIKGVMRNVVDKLVSDKIITFDFFKNLLKKDAKESISQQKWNRDFTSTINIFHTTYEIKQNSNKRELIYQNVLQLTRKFYLQKNF